MVPSAEADDDDDDDDDDVYCELGPVTTDFQQSLFDSSKDADIGRTAIL